MNRKVGSTECGVALAAMLMAGSALSTAVQADSSSLIAARQKIFGVENVRLHNGHLNPNKVILSWLSNSTLAVSIAGHVMLLDTYVTRLELEPGRTPFVIEDLVALQPETILVGHGHFDHADNAAYIAARTGAEIYATEETCAAMQTDFARELADPAIQGNPATAFPSNASITCKAVTTAGSIPGTQVIKLDFLEPDACVIAFRHLHSVAVPVDPTWPRAPTPSTYYAADPRDPELFPAGTPLEPGRNGTLPGQINIASSGNRGPGGPTPLLFDFVLRNNRHFTFVWYDSSGALKEGLGSGWPNGTPADGQRIINILKSLPATDVDAGTVATGNFDNNTFRDPFAYIQALNPKIIIPMHLTTGTTFKESVAAAVYGGYLDQIKRLGLTRDQWPDTRWLVDPEDYLKPIVYDVHDERWENPKKLPAINALCGPDQSYLNRDKHDHKEW